MKITNSQFKEIIKKGLSLDYIFILEKIAKKEDVRDLNEGKISNLILTLERKGFLKNMEITGLGKDLLKSIKEGKETITLGRIEAVEDKWEKFLKSFPPNNKFIWNGKQFDGDRSIRKNTKDGKSIFAIILSSGDYTCEEIINAVIAESVNKMESSFRTGQNKMNYFVNTESYLRQRLFVNWVEEGKSLTEEEIAKYYEAFNRKRASKPTSVEI